MCKKALDLKVREYGSGYGMSIYSEQELLSIATGIEPEKFTGTLADIFAAPRTVPGIGERKELVLLAVKELSMRLARKVDTRIEVIREPGDAFRFAMPHFLHVSKEHFAVLILNTKNHVIGLRDISIGSLTASIVHPREVFQEAIKNSAASIILLHNHPSGDPTPSKEDIAVTQRLVKAGTIMDIPVLDHVVIGDHRYVSMKERGLIS